MAAIDEFSTGIGFMEEEEEEQDAFSKKVICLSGTLDMGDRKTVEALMTQSGAKVSKSITNATTTLVCGREEKQSTKLTTALEKGIEIWSELDLRHALGFGAEEEGLSVPLSGQVSPPVLPKPNKRKVPIALSPEAGSDENDMPNTTKPTETKKRSEGKAKAVEASNLEGKNAPASEKKKRGRPSKKSKA